MVVFGIVLKSLTFGCQGICSSTLHINVQNLVPIKILNTTNKPVIVYKDKPLGESVLLDNQYDIKTYTTG